MKFCLFFCRIFATKTTSIVMTLPDVAFVVKPAVLRDLVNYDV